MRTLYREQMDEFAHTLIVMCDHVQSMHKGATKALFEADLTAAEQVISSVDRLKDLRTTCQNSAFDLLARETPVARDLRQVVSGIYIVEDIDRMGALTVHIASAARRRFPNKVLSEEVEGYFQEMASVSAKMTHLTRQILIDYDPEQALELEHIDDGIDDIHQHLFALTTGENWDHSPAETVDITLLSRFFERYADHAVLVANRIIYLATGLKQDEYLEHKDYEAEQQVIARRLSDLERNLGYY